MEFAIVIKRYTAHNQ